MAKTSTLKRKLTSVVVLKKKTQKNIYCVYKYESLGHN